MPPVPDTAPQAPAVPKEMEERRRLGGRRSPSRRRGAPATPMEMDGRRRDLPGVMLASAARTPATPKEMEERMEMEEHRRESTFAAPEACADRFFALPFDAIAGFGEVAQAARSLATLPAHLDLHHFARAGEDSTIARNRRRLLAPPDVARMAFFERRYDAAKKLERRVRHLAAARGKAEPAEQAKPDEDRHQWRIGPTNCYFKNPSPRIAPLRQSMDRFFAGPCPCIGDQLYPPGAFRGWHTDRFGYVGWVVFLVEVAQPGKSSFRYVHPRTGAMVVVPDRNEVAYFFRPSAEEPLFWHAVLCEDTFRWSQGFSLPRHWRSRLRLTPPEGA